MYLRDFEKVVFEFENILVMTIRKEDIKYIKVSDKSISLEGKQARRVTICLKSDAVPLKVIPDTSGWENVPKRINNVSNRVINHFEASRGCGDLYSVELYKSNNSRQVLYPAWSRDDIKRKDFNLYQYSGFDVDDNYELTGFYKIEFFVETKKTYEYVDEDARYVRDIAYPKTTLLPYILLFNNIHSKDNYHLNNCVLIDTEEQYIPVSVDSGDDVYIKNCWLNDLKPYDEEKVNQCMEFISKYRDDIFSYNCRNINARELLGILDEASKHEEQ